MSNLSELLPAGAGAKSATFVASGTLASGQTVILNADGTVEAVAAAGGPPEAGTSVTFNSTSQELATTYDSNSNKVVIAFRDQGNSNYGTAVVGTVSGTSISFGTPVVFGTGTYIGEPSATFDSNSNKVVIVFRDLISSPYICRAVVGTVSGTSISFGSLVNVTSYAIGDNTSTTFDSTNNKVVIAYAHTTSAGYGTAIVGTVSGTSISFGTGVTFESADTSRIAATFDSNSGKVVISYCDIGNSNYGTGIVGTVSGTSISFGTAVVFNSSSTYNIGNTFDSNSNKVVTSYRNGGNSNYGTAIVGTVSGTSISFGTAVVFNSANPSASSPVFDSTNNKVVISYSNSGNSSYGTAIVGTVSGTSISFGTAVVFEADGTAYVGATFDSANNKVAIAYTNNASAGLGVVFTTSGSNNTDFIGITDEAISSAASGSVIVQGGVITNTGLIPLAQGVGAEFVFEAATSNYNVATYDSNSNKVVIGYRDGGNSYYGTSIVGTVSGTSISFGTPVVFESGNTTDLAATFDSNSNKAVFSYADGGNSDYGTAIVGTVSGTSISFGTAVIFESAGSNYISATFDSTNNKVVIAYADVGNGYYGTSIVGTVSGTSISFGSAVVFRSGSTSYPSATFDTANSKVVIAYTENAVTQYGNAIVGTVSGTSISFGTAVVFSSNAVVTYNAATFDTTNSKVVIAYSDEENSYYGTSIVGTVSGTSISFGTAVVFETATTQYISATFDSNANKVVLAYKDNGTTEGKTIAGTVSGTSISFEAAVVFNTDNTSNLKVTYDSTNNKVVIVYSDVGNSYYGTATVSEFTSTLTIGTDYFVQTDGTISTTTSTVPAGRALSTTSILLEG